MLLISDEMLAQQTLKGELSAFEELVNRYKAKVCAIVYRMVGQYQEAEDISQEVFLTVYEKLYQYDPSKPFAPWICRIAANASITVLRKKKKVVILNFDETYGKPLDYYPVPSIDPELELEKKELKEEINSAIMELPDSYRTVITLRYQMDYSNQEIADLLGITRENVEVKVHRARRALRKIVIKNWEERGMKNALPANR
jgi:RNA polymerase sigma-70 factor (ECF subfamily)